MSRSRTHACHRLQKRIVRLLPEQRRAMKAIWRMLDVGEIFTKTYSSWWEFRAYMWWSQSRPGLIVVPNTNDLIYVTPDGELMSWTEATNKEGLIKDYVKDLAAKNKFLEEGGYTRQGRVEDVP